MSTLRTLARLPRNERALFFRALLVIVAMRLGLLALSFERMQQLTKSKPGMVVDSDLPIPRFVWAVRAASRRVPTASCLTQSLSLHYLLNRTGYDSQIRIGVAKEPNAAFRAHGDTSAVGLVPRTLFAVARPLYRSHDPSAHENHREWRRDHGPVRRRSVRGGRGGVGRERGDGDGRRHRREHHERGRRRG